MEREVYIIPKYLDEDYKVLGLIPVDVLFVFLFLFISLLWLLGHFKAVIISLLVSVSYQRYVKKRGRGYWKLLLFKLGFLEVDGAVPPTEKEIRA